MFYKFIEIEVIWFKAWCDVLTDICCLKDMFKIWYVLQMIYGLVKENICYGLRFSVLCFKIWYGWKYMVIIFTDMIWYNKTKLHILLSNIMYISVWHTWVYLKICFNDMICDMIKHMYALHTHVISHAWICNTNIQSTHARWMKEF